jgi:RNA polymerase-interacting CarD/CdnL/TRCF family regulator
MLEVLKLKVGDLMVRYGRVLKITKISKGVVFLKPYFDAKNNMGRLSYSLPIKNMKMNKLRRVLSKGELDKLLKKALMEPDKDKELLALKMKDPLENNDLAETMKVVRMLWLEKRANSGSLPGGKLTVYKQALEQLVGEAAAICGLTLEKADIKINTVLKAIG